MATIPQKELRNNVGEVLRRAESGEQLIVTVAGRAVAELGPIRDRSWVRGRALADLWALPVDPALAAELSELGGLDDPWERG